jgi:membrane-bound ClpP family serine protease
LSVATSVGSAAGRALAPAMTPNKAVIASEMVRHAAEFGRFMGRDPRLADSRASNSAVLQPAIQQ